MDLGFENNPRSSCLLLNVFRGLYSSLRSIGYNSFLNGYTIRFQDRFGLIFVNIHWKSNKIGAKIVKNIVLISIKLDTISHPMIRLSEIVKSYGDLKVLKGISVEIQAAEIVSIVGDSGAGKTTLLQIAGTLDSPDSGKIFYKDQDISNFSGNALSAFRNQNIGFIFQFHQLLPEFTCLENVCLPAMIAGKSIKQSEARASELLGYLGLSHRLKHQPSELSGGEQQRCAVARALMNNPGVVFADEPS